MRQSRGFTLIELLVVIAIISLLKTPPPFFV
jgi:prepilin-type N-terminal cleavage/methylation domain-containing protein